MFSMLSQTPLHAGLDAGSTTLKFVIINVGGEVLFSSYRRHHADIAATLRAILQNVVEKFSAETPLSLVVTGSAGLGLAEKLALPFLQESIAAAAMARYWHPSVRTLVDVGGEDAKMIFFESGHAPDIRMNGACAGGTGAFLDQIATLLNCEASALNMMAEQACALHPVASRCGVFAKTDIQSLLSRNVAPADIAASAFHAVAHQIVATLARGRDILTPVLFCGGPLAHLKHLRHACAEAMGVSLGECIIPENAALVPALGCAVATDVARHVLSLGELLALGGGHHFSTRAKVSVPDGTPCKTCIGAQASETPPASPVLLPLFQDSVEYAAWRHGKELCRLPRTSLDSPEAGDECWIGMDSGSTTTKIVALSREGALLFSYYAPNNGNPLEAARLGLEKFHTASVAAGKPVMQVRATAVTGYGEDLLRAAFGLDVGVVETMAHYQAARRLEPDVSFLLDIGGQDMKAVFIENGAIVRLDVNEACSSGCGSFIDGFARSLQLTAPEFASLACEAQRPCDLGTRCTVFMNSKVKQAQRESATRADIAAGLAYSVAKNCLYKVLKLKSPAELGPRIVVQGGTMRNNAVVRALELLTGREITVAPIPELMGAYGAALHVLQEAPREGRSLAGLASPGRHDTADTICPGCENRCLVRKHVFENENVFYSGNKCEKVFSTRGSAVSRGANFHAFKQRLLFKRSEGGKAASNTSAAQKTIVGIPRVLNFYENFPFWHALLTRAGFAVTLSGPSTFKMHGRGVRSIMSDNICFPAKLVHGHVHDLIEKKVDRILMPFVLREQEDEAGASAKRSYNCPIVSGYADVIRSAIDTEGRHGGVLLDSPVLTFGDPGLLRKACREYIVGTLGAHARDFDTAFKVALAAQREFTETLTSKIRAIVAESEAARRPLILLAGRPYHTDPLLQHKVADMFADLGADTISEDVVRGLASLGSAWAYPSRIIASAAWVAQAPSHVHFVQITSFGCGPDAFIIDEIGDLLRHAGKSHTVLKVDDINNPGSLRLRARSLLESLGQRRAFATTTPKAVPAAAKFNEEDRRRTILIPFFSEIYSPFIPAIMELMGYRTHALPPSCDESINHGLQHANNEICYPATLVIGDFVRALKSGRFRREEVALGITQTGGQCRASSYLTLIKRALVTAGFHDVPVVSVGTVAGAVENDQPGFRLRWQGNIRALAEGMLYADHIGQMYNATAPREKECGAAARLRDSYINAGVACLARRELKALRELLGRAATDFNHAAEAREVPRVGIVGEIYIKYNAVGNRNIVEWLISQGVEPVVPPLADFFLQEIPNRRFNRHNALSRRAWSDWVDKVAYRFIRHWQRQYAGRASPFRYHHEGPDIFEKAESARRIVSLAGQYGEGWLIPAELAAFAERGIHNAVSLQPFGCIANHIVAKGIERRVRELYPKMNLLFLDLDSGTSEANLLNRLHFIVQNARDAVQAETKSKGD